LNKFGRLYSLLLQGEKELSPRQKRISMGDVKTKKIDERCGEFVTFPGTDGSFLGKTYPQADFF